MRRRRHLPATTSLLAAGSACLAALLAIQGAAASAEDVAPTPVEPARPAVLSGATASSLSAPASDPLPAPSDYLIGPGDLLEVTVFEEASLNRTVRVGPDGAIGLPLLGAIQTAGRNRGELEAEIVRRLAEHFLFDPQVSVFVKEYRSRRVAIVGAVNAPGSYELVARRTLLEMISEAGGLAPAAGRDLFVFGHGRDGSTTRTQVDLVRLMMGGEAALNVQVREGDIISVPPEKPVAVYLYGAVGQPGMIEARSAERLTLLQAITRAGGPAQRAAVERIVILRDSVDGRVRLRANLKKIIAGKEEDPCLATDDVVVVPESFF